MGLLEELITKHVKRRDFLSQDNGQGSNNHKLRIKPFITVSREAGSGGKPIAKIIAKRLGYKYYNKKLLDLIARKTKKRKELIKTLDEKDRGFVEDLVFSLLSPDYVPDSTYFKNLCKVVLSLARKGNCVILGRGANFITSEYGGFHVRIAAPFLVRTGYMAQYEGCTIYEARERMKKLDKDRKVFVKRFFSKDPSNANYYDLVVNTTYLRTKEAAETILAAFKQKYPDWKKYK